jgi:hypothetical protein
MYGQNNHSTILGIYSVSRRVRDESKHAREHGHKPLGSLGIALEIAGGEPLSLPEITSDSIGGAGRRGRALT